MECWRASGSADVVSLTGALKNFRGAMYKYAHVRTVYPDFVHRFIIIKPKEVHAAMPDLKACTKIILESIEAMNDKWRIGHTKVFFR